MKELLLGIVLIVLLGIGGFFYRNAMERPLPKPVMCTEEAKLCPDGTGVGRVGPACAFAPCPFPNAEDSAIGIAFVVPEGYVSNPDPIGPDETLRAVFETPSLTEGIPHALIIRRYPMAPGETAEDVIVRETLFETSDMGAESIDQFKKETIGGREYYAVVVERFEAQIHSLYYLPREKDVLRFEALERDVTEWMDPSLDLEMLPAHKALLSILETLQI